MSNARNSIGTILIASVLGIGGTTAAWWDQAGPSRPLAEDQLGSVFGADRNKYFNDTFTCDEYMAVVWNGNHPGANTVGQDGCVAGISSPNVNPAAQCFQCNPPGGNVQLNVRTDPLGNYPPGLKLADSDSCGSVKVGACVIVNGVPTCDNPQPIGGRSSCYDIAEWWNQPPPSQDPPAGQ